jgi:hypothetical protein
MAAMTSFSLSVMTAASVTSVSHQMQHQLERTPVLRPRRLNPLLKGDHEHVH